MSSLGDQKQGFKPSVAVKTEEIEFLVCDFWIWGVGVCPLLLMVVHGEWQAKRQVCRWSRAFVVWDMPKVLAPVSELDYGYWLASHFPNQLGRARVVTLPKLCTCSCQFGESTHGFKPGVAVNTQDSEFLVCDFWIWGVGFLPIIMNGCAWGMAGKEAGL